ncbi:hypothetical protein BCON_0076g00330 [Botryotinia convoluta]|uniref:Uncharacterized protein n=1 Tax=Botryotinia convoluta TaxID=54673 RepID=A0A4Z1I5H0_9HELO|nr:hypothetical protein BCON_0076g00330 [Botryotinia convoluta]
MIADRCHRDQCGNNRIKAELRYVSSWIVISGPDYLIGHIVVQLETDLDICQNSFTHRTAASIKSLCVIQVELAKTREFKVSSRRKRLPRQRIGETRWTELKSNKVLRSLPFPIDLSKGRQSPPASWGVERNLMTEEDDSNHTKIQIGLTPAPRRLYEAPPIL